MWLVCKSCNDHRTVFNRKIEPCVSYISANAILNTSSNNNHTDGYFLNGDAVQWKKCPGRKVNAMRECFTWRKGERRNSKMLETGRRNVKSHTRYPRVNPMVVNVKVQVEKSLAPYLRQLTVSSASILFLPPPHAQPGNALFMSICTAAKLLGKCSCVV